MSRLPFELLLAWRYLRPKRTFVSIITLISVLGVTLGVSVLIIVISVMSGFDKQLKDKLFGFSAHVTVYQFDPNRGGVAMTNAAYVMKIADANPLVRGSGPLITGQVMLETEPDTPPAQVAAPYLRGLDPKSMAGLGLIVTNIVSGSSDLSGNGILVGTDFAAQYRLSIGDHVALSSASDVQKMRDSRKTGHDELIPPDDYEVRGVFDTGFNEYNTSVVITSLVNAQDLTGLGNDVDGVNIMLHDPSDADRVADDLEKKLGAQYRARTWEQGNTGMQAVMVEKDVMFYIMFFIVIVAAFGITCTLITFIVLKTREIGVMKAIGATSRQIMWIFLSQSLIVSCFGVMFGTGLGLLAVAYRNPFLHFMRRVTHLELFPAKVYFFTELPAQILPGDIAIICGGSLIICVLAAAFPAWNASRLKPVEALRHE